jgi:hypothetical protein
MGVHWLFWARFTHSKCLNDRLKAAVQAGSEARSNLCLLGDFKGIVDFDAEVTHGAFKPMSRST